MLRHFSSVCEVARRVGAAAVLVRRIDVVKLWDVSDRKAAPAPPLRCGVKLQTKIREDFTITISWLQAHTFETLLIKTLC